MARGAALRFLLTRAYDWLHTPADALVTRKDPLDFARRLSFYAAQGVKAFPAKTAVHGNQPLAPKIVNGVKVYELTATEMNSALRHGSEYCRCGAE